MVLQIYIKWETQYKKKQTPTHSYILAKKSTCTCCLVTAPANNYLSSLRKELRQRLYVVYYGTYIHDIHVAMHAYTSGPHRAKAWLREASRVLSAEIAGAWMHTICACILRIPRLRSTFCRLRRSMESVKHIHVTSFTTRSHLPNY